MRQEVIAEMKRQGITQTALSEMTKIPQSRLSEWLSGKRPRGATEQTINAVCTALGLTLTPTKKTRAKSTR